MSARLPSASVSARPTILVVDDDADARESVQDLLTTEGYGVIGVRNGEEALAYLAKNPTPAAVLLDLFMPVMNGWTFTRRLRGTRFENLPVILMTASGPHWGYPVERVVRKPIDPDELLGLVRACC